MTGELSRRAFLTACVAAWGPQALRAIRHEPQAADPLASYKLAWTRKIRWDTVIDFASVPGATNDEKLKNAIALATMKGGGVVQFPAGTFRFTDTIRLVEGVVLRGAEPAVVTRAHHDRYAPPTVFEFPKYEPQLEGDGTDIRKAFKGIYLAEPATASNVGVLNITINRGHIHFADAGASAKFAAGRNRFVVGCVLRNAAVADPNVPNLPAGQKAWQRFTARHHAAINLKSAENALIANNRLPRSGDDNFTMNGYVLTKGRDTITIDGVVFDYDNRPGLLVNHYAIGGAGGMGPDGTPESHPHGFRKGIVIADNFIFNTGRMGIGFCGDGVRCINNIIRMPENLWRPTTTGIAATTGSSTNDNRAIEMRGWRWVVDGNEYTVHRHWAFDKKYKINDGEGLMHEDHVNSTIRDSVLTNNRGNAYLSLYKCAGIDGLLIEGNEIHLSDGKPTTASGAAIYVNADRNTARFPVKRVHIVKNTLKGGGILLRGDPSEKNVIRGNKFVGSEKAKIILQADAEVADNSGLEVEKSS
ncbi:MAG: hypothetical protein RMJ56_15120 [Gemmataceae bacterium]|nr:glycoside hydrolase family 55 protein [Gemmata sp.]MDW8198927.1 hypothetical protein [Gemmataceae bacterium]